MADTNVFPLGLPVPASPDAELEILEQGGANRGREVVTQLCIAGAVPTQGEVTVGTSTTVIVAANPKRISLFLLSEADAGQNIRIAAGTAALTTHWPLYTANSWTDTVSQLAWNGIASAAGQVIRYFEWSRA